MAALEQVSETPSSSSSSSPILIPGEWSNAANAIVYDSEASSPPIALICGAKNSGKSTFSRFLLNTLLSRYKRVAYLDTDVGQPEFTPSGCLSLSIIDQATPDLTIPCLKTPERCYFYGDLSSKRDPEGYLNCVVALHDHYKREHCSSRKYGISANVPLIVNTPGWVKGIGFDVLVGMLKHMAPTHVVKINISSEVIYVKRKKINPEDKNLPPGLFWLDVDDNDDAPVNLLEITSASKDCNGRPVLVQKEARLNRELRLMVYFRQCFPSDASITTIKELAHALASHTPYQVPISCVKIRHLHCQVPATEVLYSLNATVIGLAVSSGDCQSLPSCVGLGIVRGIDVSKNLLYMITPVQLSVLATVDIILQGFIQIPTSLLQVLVLLSLPLPFRPSHLLVSYLQPISSFVIVSWLFLRARRKLMHYIADTALSWPDFLFPWSIGFVDCSQEGKLYNTFLNFFIVTYHEEQPFYVVVFIYGSCQSHSYMPLATLGDIESQDNRV